MMFAGPSRPLTVVLLLLGLLAAGFGLSGTSAAPAPASSNAPASQTSRTIVVEVKTPDYNITDTGITVEGYATNDQPGAPALPVVRKLIELPQTGTWTATFRGTPQSLTLAAGISIPSVPAPAKGREDFTNWWYDEGDSTMFVPTVIEPDSAIYQKNALYPAQPMVVGEEFWERGKRQVVVTVFPFRYNPLSGELLYYPDVAIQVDVKGMTAAEGTLRGNNTNVLQPVNSAASPSVGGGSVRINTAGAGGMTRLTYADLQAAGVPVATINPNTFAMNYAGSPMAIQVTGDGDGSFDPADKIIFYAMPYVGRYMTSNVYWLTYGSGTGVRMSNRAAPQNNALIPSTSYTETTRVEFNRLYISTIAAGLNNDVYWDNPISPNNSAPPGSATKHTVYNLTLDDPTRVGTVSVRANIHGLTNQSYNPDHAVRMTLNGSNLGTYTWEGAVEYLAESSTSATLLTTSTNQLTLTAALEYIPGCPPECPFSYTIYPNWIEVDYNAAADVEGDSILLKAMPSTTQRVRMTGFSLASGGTVRAYDLRNPMQPVALTTTSATNTGSSYTVDFWDNPSTPATYLVSTEASLLPPVSVQVDSPSTWRTPNNTADYIAIVPEMLMLPTPGYTSVNDLLAFRQADGFQTAKVSVQDIYDEFSGGKIDPQAIRDFINYAYFNWNGTGEPPEYVILVGDGHIDFKNYDNSPLFNLIPPYMLPVDPFIGEAVTDNRYASVDGFDDYVPDLKIGRLPVQIKLDPGQQVPPSFLPPAYDLDSMLDKIIANETTSPGGAWQSRVVYVADNFADPAGNFHELSNFVIDNFQPDRYVETKLYFNTPEIPNTTVMKNEIRNAFNNDALIIQWFGHGSAFRWGFTSQYNIYDTEGYNGATATQVNQQFPLTVSYACVTSNFIRTTSNANTYTTHGESFIRATQRGSVADIGPTGNHVGSAMIQLNEGVIKSALQDRTQRVGAILNESKVFYLENASFFFDLVDTTVLFGDPASKLKLPPIAHGGSTLTVNDDTPNPNQVVQFTLTVANTDTVALNNTTLTVDYDETLLTIVSAPGWLNNGNVLTQNIATVPVGGVSRTFTAQVIGTATNGTLIDTTAVASVAQENVFLSAPMTVVGLPTATPTNTNTPIPPTATNTPTITPTNTPGPSPTPTNTTTPTVTRTPTNTRTPGPPMTSTPTPTITMTPSATNTPTITPTNTPGPSPTATATHTPGPSPTATTTGTATSVPPTMTPTPTPPTITPIVTVTQMPTITNTPVVSNTPTATKIPAVTPTATVTAGSPRIFLPLVRRN